MTHIEKIVGLYIFGFIAAFFLSDMICRYTDYKAKKDADNE